MLKLKTKLVIMMVENGKVQAEVARRLKITKQRVGAIMTAYYKTPYGQRQLKYRLKRYFCEVCGQPRKATIEVEGMRVDMCAECLLTVRRGNKRYYPNRFDWSVNYPECVECQSTKYHHVAHGRCAKCYPDYKQRARSIDFRTATSI